MFRCRDSNSDKIIIGLVVSYKQREPKLLLRLSENGGYLSRSAISCIDYRLATLGTQCLRYNHLNYEVGLMRFSTLASS